jgi:SLIT-ROBO Rho GTPase activating protein
MDYGYHVSLGQLEMASVAAEQYVCQTREASLQQLAMKAKELNQREDRQAFLQLYHKVFSLPKKFEFQPHKGDPVSNLSTVK